MKSLQKIFSVTTLAVACSAASAQQTAPLSVTGNIKPSGCTASISNGGAFEYRDINGDSLGNDDFGTLLPQPQSATFYISCPSPAQVAWRLIDNRSDSESFDLHNQGFGLGKDGAGNNIGAYTVTMSAPILDGANAWIVTFDGAYWNWVDPTGYTLQVDKDYTYAKTGNLDTMDKGSAFSATMVIKTTIAPKRSLDTSGVIELDGSSTINLSYL